MVIARRESRALSRPSYCQTVQKWYVCCSQCARTPQPASALCATARQAPIRRIPRDPRLGVLVNEKQEIGGGESVGSESSVHSTAGPSGEDVSIFSASAVELVHQWWRDSNRRWAETNALKSPA